MKSKANTKRKVVIITVAIASIWCTILGLNDGNVVAQRSAERFDPLSLPVRDLVAPGYTLDPLSFNSDQAYSIRSGLGAPRRHITKSELHDSNSLRDIIPEYPSNWIKDYTSVEISTKGNGKALSALSTNDELSLEQVSMLNNAEIGSTIEIKVLYRSKNSATHLVENTTLKLSTTIVPETEASYIGGYDLLIADIKGAILSQIPKNSGWLKPPTVRFVINQQGIPQDVELVASTGNEKVDRIIINAIQDMPNWDPATDAHGQTVDQIFEFRVGNKGC